GSSPSSPPRWKTTRRRGTMPPCAGPARSTGAFARRSTSFFSDGSKPRSDLGHKAGLAALSPAFQPDSLGHHDAPAGAPLEERRLGLLRGDFLGSLAGAHLGGRLSPRLSFASRRVQYGARRAPRHLDAGGLPARTVRVAFHEPPAAPPAGGLP